MTFNKTLILQLSNSIYLRALLKDIKFGGIKPLMHSELILHMQFLIMGPQLSQLAKLIINMFCELQYCKVGCRLIEASEDYIVRSSGCISFIAFSSLSASGSSEHVLYDALLMF